jgi:outer membrane biosynthesis protein TonB
MREIFNSHPVSVLKKEISKTNIKGYSKMKKAQIVDLMMKNKERFKHIKMAEKKAPAPAPAKKAPAPAKKPATPPKKAPPKKKKIKFNVLPKTPPKPKTPSPPKASAKPLPKSFPRSEFYAGDIAIMPLPAYGNTEEGRKEYQKDKVEKFEKDIDGLEKQLAKIMKSDSKYERDTIGRRIRKKIEGAKFQLRYLKSKNFLDEIVRKNPRKFTEKEEDDFIKKVRFDERNEKGARYLGLEATREGYLGNTATKQKLKFEDTTKRRLGALFRKAMDRPLKRVTSREMEDIVRLVLKTAQVPLDKVKEVYDKYLSNLQRTDY